MPKIRKTRTIIIIFWAVLLYIIAALAWWFISLEQMNRRVLDMRLQTLNVQAENYSSQKTAILQQAQKKTVQYISEGLTFLILLIVAALYLFQLIRLRLRNSEQQKDFFMALSHEIKTPIAITKLNLETILKRELEPPVRHKLLNNSLIEINRVNNLFNNLVLSSQIETGRYIREQEDIDLSELVNAQVKQEALRGNGGRIETHVEEGIGIVGDKLEMELLISNLLANALKYSGEKVSIVLKKENERTATLKIKDNGPGIPEKERSKIFLKHYRIGNEATRKAKGAGLGLYLVHNIVKNHRGSITVHANEPTGSIFTIRFPAK